MAGPRTRRRELLGKAAALLGVGAVGSLSGCAQSEPSGTGPEVGRAGVVPDSAVSVSHVNVRRVLADSALREGINEQLATYSGPSGDSRAPATVGAWLDRVDAGTGLDPRGLDEVLSFFTDDPVGWATVLWADWSPETALTQLGAGSPGAERTYEGRQLRESAGFGTVAVLSDGSYAVGRPGTVRTIIDVRDGRADRLTGEAGEAYASSRGMARFVATVARHALAPFPFDLPIDAVDPRTFRYVEHVFGSVYRDGSDRGVAVSIAAPSAGDAGYVHGAVESRRQAILDQLRPAGGGGEGESRRPVARLAAALRDATISRDGGVVTVRYVAPAPEFVRDAAAALVSAAPDVGGGVPRL
jgi:hypothetical protein